MFALDLARELGMSLRRLLAETDARDLALWRAYFAFERKREQRAEMEARAQAGRDQAKSLLKR